ncbi:hypothetical protein A2U01_0077007, partial [Trifolium medium]|nr:hypothetical protein [Trifolium medium]
NQRKLEGVDSRVREDWSFKAMVAREKVDREDDVLDVAVERRKLYVQSMGELDPLELNV